MRKNSKIKEVSVREKEREREFYKESTVFEFAQAERWWAMVMQFSGSQSGWFINRLLGREKKQSECDIHRQKQYSSSK